MYVVKNKINSSVYFSAMKRSSVAQRLREFGVSLFGEEHGWQKRFADALEMSPQALGNYLAGRIKPGNEVQGKLRKLGCDIEWLMTGRKVSSDALEIPGQVRILVYDSLPTGKEPCPPSESETIFLSYSMPKPEQLRGLRVSGNEMEPTLRDGDIAIFDPTSSAVSGRVCVMSIRGDRLSVVRRIHLQHQTATITANNPAIPPRVVKWSDILAAHPVVEVYSRRRGENL